MLKPFRLFRNVALNWFKSQSDTLQLQNDVNTTQDKRFNDQKGNMWKNWGIEEIQDRKLKIPKYLFDMQLSFRL